MPAPGGGAVATWSCNDRAIYIESEGGYEYLSK